MSRPFPPILAKSAAGLALFALVAAFFSQANDFPYFYHTDEPGKVVQIIEGKRNFHHPLLMLNASSAALTLSGVDKTFQNAAVAGRWMNAFFAAGAVVVFSALAWKWGGPVSAVCAGTLLLLENNLFEAAHYLKEDPALLFGLSCFFLASVLFWEKPNAKRTVAVGLAAGLAVSGKYIGISALLTGIPLILAHPRSDLSRGRRLLLVMAAFVAVVLIINHQVLTDFDAMRDSVHEEVYKLYSDHARKGSMQPVDYFEELLKHATSKPVLALALVYICWQFVRIRRISPPEWLVILFPLLLLIALMFTPKSSLRYFLPIAVLLNFCAAMAIGRLTSVAGNLKVGWSRSAAGITAVGLMATCVIGQLPLIAEKIAAFQNDHRRILARFIQENISPKAVIAEDNRVYLRGALTEEHDEVTPLVPNHVIGSRFVPDTGTISELQRRGVRYVAVFCADRGRFLDRNTFIDRDDLDAYERRKAFYDALERDHELVLKLKHGVSKYLNPAMELYHLNEPNENEPTSSDIGSQVPQTASEGKRQAD